MPLTAQSALSPEKETRMSAAPKPYLTPAEYLAHERLAEIKSEYYDGETFAMAGGSEEHSLIAVNVTTEMNLQLRDRPCRVYNSDMRVQVADEGPFTYPDATLVCGEAQFADTEVDTLLNPTFIVEVLSPTTEARDRVGKFERYHQIESLQEYMLIAQDRPRVERYARQAESGWHYEVSTGLAGEVSLSSIECELPMSEIYRKVTFSENPGPRRQP
jgi:Uma2 family endonuclease